VIPKASAAPASATKNAEEGRGADGRGGKVNDSLVADQESGVQVHGSGFKYNKVIEPCRSIFVWIMFFCFFALFQKRVSFKYTTIIAGKSYDMCNFGISLTVNVPTV
jgi:hypothetical protein